MTKLARFFAAFHRVATPERLAFTLVMAVACAVTLPYLGAFGFFDPWETHYAEVARRMAEDDNYLYPSWKGTYFFSKPVLLFWLSSLGYKLIGAGDATGALPHGVELIGRLPGALTALCTVAVTYFSARRLWGLRAAVFSALVLTTIPFWGMMSRQAITDMLYVGPMSMAILLLAVAFFDDQDWKSRKIPIWFLFIFGLGLVPQLWEIGRSASFLRVGESELIARMAFSITAAILAILGLILLRKKARDPLVHAAAFLVAIATLGKGPHALLLTGLVYFLYFVLSWEWHRLKRPALLTGIALYLAVAMPWYIVMAFFTGRDDSNKTWVGRFIMWDLLGRIGGGVHGDRGTSDYYFRYLAFGMFPWGAFFPIAALQGAATRLGAVKERTKGLRFTFLCVLWSVGFFVFFTLTTTKFHHYIFPVTVPAALLVGWWLARLVGEKRPLALGVAAILALGTLVIARDLIAEPWQLVDLFTYHYKSWKPDYYFPKSPNWHLYMGIATFSALAFFLVGVALDVWRRYRGDNPVHKVADSIIGIKSANSGLVMGALIAGIFFQFFAVHVYLNSLSQHWTQRWLFDSYYEMREPGEPIIAYQMDWKGETFYGHDDEIQIKKNAADLRKACKKPGREFIIVQSDRFSRVKSALGSGLKATVVDRSSNKWFLVLVD